VLRQGVDDLPTDRPGFDARHPVLGIDPANTIHPRKVDGGDDALLVRGTHERLCDVGASAVGDQANAVLERGSDQRLDLFDSVRVDDEVRNPRELRVFDRVDLLLGVSVTVSQPAFRVVADRVVGQELPHFTEKIGILARFRNGGRVLREMGFARIKRNADRSTHPGQQVRQLGTGQVVAIAAQLDGTVGADPKTAIRKPPAVEPLTVCWAPPRGFGEDPSAVVALTHRVGPRERLAAVFSSRYGSAARIARRAIRSIRPTGGGDTAIRSRR